MLEVMIALMLVSVALVGILAAISSAMSLADSNHEQMLALNVARQKLSEIQAAPFQTLFAQYAPGMASNTFSVSNLESGSGKFIFPVNGANRLDETVVDEALGMPRDLNGNGKATDTNVSTTYTLLPVRIQVQWATPGGQRELNLNTMLVQLK